MGSPFRTCSIRLHLDWEPDMPTSGFQNLSAQSPDARYLALVRWHTPDNQPGFVVYTLDTVARTVAVSQPQAGCCERLWWDGGFRWSAAA
jgi:hypothetical protein